MVTARRVAGFDEAIVRTKVVPPHRRVGLLRRQRLVDFLHENTHRKLILISAGPGYGKTSLLLDFLQDTELKTCWYSMDPSDVDPWVFVTHLAASIAQAFPHLDERLIPRARSGIAGDTTPQQALRQIVNQVQREIVEYFVIVIDDFQYVDGSKAVRDLVVWWLDHVPDNCSLMMASRTMPVLPYLKLTARQEVAGLGNQELAFTPNEIREYLLLNHNLEVPQEEAERLAEETEGWITAILLGTHTLWKGLLRSIVEARGMEAQVFDYLAQEVFDSQPEAIRDFLKATSVLKVMRPSLCDALLGRSDSEELLEDLERRNLFLTRLSGKQKAYRYHALFQDFLQRRFHGPEEVDRRILEYTAGRLAEGEGDGESALGYYLAAGEREEAARLVKVQMEQAYQSGRLVTLSSWLDALGHAVVASDPELAVMQGRLHRQKGEFEQALRFFQRAASLYSERGDRAGEAGANVRKALVHRYQGDLARAREISEEVLRQARAIGLDPRSEALAQRILGEFHHVSGQLAEAKRAFRRSLKLYEQAGDQYQVAALSQALGTTARRMGNPLEAEGHYRKALKLLQALGNQWRVADIKNNIAVGYYYQGEYEKAEELLKEALAEATSVGHGRTEAAVLVGLGDLRLDLGDLRQAQDYYQQGLEGIRLVGDTFLEVYVLCARAHLYRLDAAWEQAHSILDEADHILAGNPSGYARGLVMLARGALHLSEGDSADALQALKESAEELETAGAKRELCKSRLWQGFSLYRAHGISKATEPLKAALSLCEEIAHPHLLVPDGRWMVPYLEEARREEAEIRDALDGLLARIHQFTLSLPRRLGETPQREIRPPHTEVVAFGQGLVKIDGKAVPHTAWGGPLVRELFFYLLERGPVRREAILATFWPEYSTARAKEVFHASVYRMRRVLPEGAIAFEPDNEGYRVETSGDFWYDAMAFEVLMGRSQKKGPDEEQLLQQAVAIYRGDFLPESGSEWARARREELRSAWVDAVVRLASLFEARGESARAIETLRRVVREEPYREDLHRSLMKMLASAGRQAEALALYHKLKKTLEEELEVGPAAETEAVQREILQSSDQVSP